MTAPTPEQLGQFTARAATDMGTQMAALQARLAAAFDVPPWVMGLEPPPPPAPRTRRQRVAAHVGQAGWRAGYTVAQAGRLLERLGDRLSVAGDRVIDGGDWLAARVAGR